MDQGNRDRERGTLERVGEDLGSAAGRAMGRGSDMAAGMLGSFLGTAIDSLGDWWATPDAEKAAGTFGDAQDRTCRQHFDAKAPANTNREYQEVRPLYQFGHVAGQNPQYQGRDFNEIEPDLQRAWNEESRRSHGDWDEVRGYVGFGFSQDDVDMPRDS